jgi:hypothetical protein
MTSTTERHALGYALPQGGQNRLRALAGELRLLSLGVQGACRIDQVLRLAGLPADPYDSADLADADAEVPGRFRACRTDHGHPCQAGPGSDNGWRSTISSA